MTQMLLKFPREFSGPHFVGIKTMEDTKLLQYNHKLFLLYIEVYDPYYLKKNHPFKSKNCVADKPRKYLLAMEYKKLLTCVG